MKKLIGYVTAWMLYYIGDLTYRLVEYIPNSYSAYHWLMYKSMNIQYWAGNETPWRHVNNK
jgi:hypothetical protein